MVAVSWLIVCTALAALGAPAYGKAPDIKVFECSEGRGFQVQVAADGHAAAVRTSDRRYVLPKKPGSLGERFSSAEATLIIDGQFAAFVARKKAEEYSQCSEIGPAPRYWVGERNHPSRSK